MEERLDDAINVLRNHAESQAESLRAVAAAAAAHHQLPGSLNAVLAAAAAAASSNPHHAAAHSNGLALGYHLEHLPSPHPGTPGSAPPSATPSSGLPPAAQGSYPTGLPPSADTDGSIKLERLTGGTSECSHI
jgi:hypothetical protein